MSKKSKSEKNIGNILMFAGLFMVSFCFGIYGGSFLDRYLDVYDLLPIDYLIYMLFTIASVALSIYLHIIIHEGGHLVFGLLTGYRFSSFRIGSFILIKKQGKLKLRRFWLKGTAGQCLLIPPEMKDGRMPVTLYNFGGIIFNMLAALISLPLCFAFGDNLYALTPLVFFSFIGFALALANGIPLNISGFPNDGHNALSLAKHPVAMKALWQELTVSAYQSDDVRLRDMPEDLFYMPDKNDDRDNALAYQPIVYAINEMLDRGEYETAAWLIGDVINSENALVDIYKTLLTCDLIYCKLVLGGELEFIKSYLNKKHIGAMKNLKNLPSVMRTEYTIALLIEEDTAKAQKIKTRFEKFAKNYAYSGVIESERELMNYAKEVYENGNN